MIFRLVTMQQTSIADWIPANPTRVYTDNGLAPESANALSVVKVKQSSAMRMVAKNAREGGTGAATTPATLEVNRSPREDRRSISRENNDEYSPFVHKAKPSASSSPVFLWAIMFSCVNNPFHTVKIRPFFS